MRALRIPLLLFVAGIACAEEGALPPSEFVYCTTCHGVQMMGNEALGAPRLSGMDAWYVAKQLRAFRLGWRGGHDSDAAGREMAPMALALDDGQIDAAAHWVAGTRSPPPEPTLDGNPADGELLYTTCSSCHGVNGEGNPQLGSPALHGLNDWYLAEQLRKFRQRYRGMHRDDASGQQMRAAIDILPDERAIADVVAYIQTLNDDKKPGDP